MKLFKAILTAAALFGVSTGAAMAQSSTDTATFNVTITITESCDIHTTAPTNIDFGTVTRSGTPTPLEQTGTLTVNCSLGTPYQIGLDGGINYDTTSGGTIIAPAPGGRRMALTGNYVPYDLYRETGGTLFWGNTLNTDTLTGSIGTGNNVLHTVYARLRGIDPTNVPAGIYSDTVTATVTF